MQESEECARVRARIVALNTQLKQVRPIQVGAPLTDDLRDQLRDLQDQIAEAELMLDELAC